MRERNGEMSLSLRKQVGIGSDLLLMTVVGFFVIMYEERAISLRFVCGRLGDLQITAYVRH